MNIRIFVFSAAALAGTAVLLGSGPSGAGSGRDDRDEEAHEVHEHDAARGMAEQGDILPLERILQAALQQHAGRILEAELEESHGSLVYEVEILDDNGEVFEMNFDARTGALLGEDQED